MNIPVFVNPSELFSKLPTETTKLVAVSHNVSTTALIAQIKHELRQTKFTHVVLLLENLGDDAECEKRIMTVAEAIDSCEVHGVTLPSPHFAEIVAEMESSAQVVVIDPQLN